MARKIIIDTDPGIDDSMAIFYALAAPELQVIGLTTVYGNCVVETGTKNALRLLEIAERTDIPVAKGMGHPLTRPEGNIAAFVHGEDGQGNVNLPPPRTRAVDQHAVTWLIETLMSAPTPITLVPLGPLTNIAMALLLEPRIVNKIEEIVLMGGAAFVVGNATATSEANIVNDPEAADIVFGADCPVTMIGLDVTEKVYAPAAHLDAIKNFNTPRASHLARILPFYRKFYQQYYPQFTEDGIYVHDSTTISYLLAPHLFKTVQYPIRVETQGFSRGRTTPAIGFNATRDGWEKRRKVNIAVEVDVPAVLKLEWEVLSRA